MKKLLTAPITAMTLGGISFLVTMMLLLQRPLTATPAPVHEEAESAPVENFWQTYNPEVDQLLEELQNEKAALAKKEQELRELATRIESERSELNVVTQRVHQLQIEFDQNVTRVKEEEAPNLKKLAKMYATMSPEGASAILAELDNETVVKLFSFMKETECAPLLEAMAMGGGEQAKRAAEISEALRNVLGEKKKTP